MLHYVDVTTAIVAGDSPEFIITAVKLELEKYYNLLYSNEMSRNR